MHKEPKLLRRRERYGSALLKCLQEGQIIFWWPISWHKGVKQIWWNTVKQKKGFNCKLQLRATAHIPSANKLVDVDCILQPRRRFRIFEYCCTLSKFGRASDSCPEMILHKPAK